MIRYIYEKKYVKEGKKITDFYNKYFKMKFEKENIPAEIFEKLISLDYSESGKKADEVGDYAYWLGNLYFNTFKKEGQKEADKLIDEDAYKIQEYLPMYDKLKRKNKPVRPINDIKDLPDMALELNKFKDVDTRSAKEIKKEDIIIHLDTSDWMILTPKTHPAAVEWGRLTKWCTSPDSESGLKKFNEYSSEAPLYIIIYKKGNLTDERTTITKWQIDWGLGKGELHDYLDHVIDIYLWRLDYKVPKEVTDILYGASGNSEDSLEEEIDYSKIKTIDHKGNKIRLIDNGDSYNVIGDLVI